MLVFRDTRYPIDPRAAARELGVRADALAREAMPYADAALDLAIEAGVLEAACADEWFPREDDWHRPAARLRAVTLSAARAWLAATAADGGARLHLEAVVAAALALEVPTTARAAVPEGYAFYGLYPDMYAAAVDQWAGELHDTRAVTIGIRSIGTSLAAFAAATLERRGWQTWGCTLRPRGHPFDRRVAIAPALARELSVRASWTVLVVDEGPGLSGSSFASTARALSALGIPDERIVFVASWPGNPAEFKSAAATDAWRRHRVLAGSFERTVFARGLHGYPPVHLSDVGAGRWRLLHQIAAPGVPVQPQHERRKYLVAGLTPKLLKFAGLGRFGRSAAVRSEELAGDGMVPAPERLEEGFLRSRWVSGWPLGGGDARPHVLDRIATYVALVGRRYRTGRAADPEALEPVIETNVGETFGPSALGPAACVPRPAPDAAPAVALDGHMAPHEWLQTAAGLVKADAVDHHDDHFFPGPHDIAWDLAGAIVEFDLDVDAAEALVTRYVSESADRAVRARLPFYRLAYLAFRLGMSDLAADATAGTRDGRGFLRLRDRYRAALARSLRLESHARP